MVDDQCKFARTNAKFPVIVDRTALIERRRRSRRCCFRSEDDRSLPQSYLIPQVVPQVILLGAYVKLMLLLLLLEAQCTKIDVTERVVRVRTALPGPIIPCAQYRPGHHRI